ncbi:hypothetical protein QQS21_005935 [Conoideocrella luteorostrata]|uniref:Collagen-like protein Mcl1 n=1 Tax=Conoideocrella luteorostrata TaxID=1105319 RepID=A0AAJ0FYI0_9HYPO|nr:hypothetical protein QQS21_005935 [Conoideocrella luteorostrata]
MNYSFRLLAVSATFMLPVTASRMAPRADTAGGDSNVAKVCYPEVKSGGLVPPCVSISNIEEACQPNGTKPVDFEAHSQCMCTGSYFMDWRGCQNCLFVHGYRSARDHVYWEQVISVASNSLCHASPTADFQSIFASVQANTKEAPPVTTGETKTSDEFPSKSDVSLYYTATVPQGPGVITGDAATATHVARPAATNSTSSKTSGNVDDTSPTQSSAKSNGASTTKPASSTSTGGAPAQGTGMAMAAVAGAALIMAL